MSINSSTSKFLIAFFPITLSHFIGESPDPGLLVAKFKELNSSPFFILLLATIDFLIELIFFSSLGLGIFTFDPKHFSMFFVKVGVYTDENDFFLSSSVKFDIDY